MFTTTANASTGQCLGYVVANHATCPTATAADFDYNWGPLPAGHITSVYAQTDATPGAGKSWVVNVRDNGTIVMSCTVSAGTFGCSATGSVAVSAGHFIQVQMTTADGAANKLWKVLVTYGP